MQRSLRPSSPLDDLAARSAWTGATLASGVLTTELAEFCQSGVSIITASCERDRRPVAGRALGCRIDVSGTVRLVVRSDTNEAVRNAVSQGGGLAVTFSQPTTHRSIQFKATLAKICDPEASDQQLAAVQTAGFRAELVAVGYTETLASRYCSFEPDRLFAIEFVPVLAFVQTPGPGAGAPLTP